METKRQRHLRLFLAAALALLLAPPLFSDTVTLPAVTSLPVGSAASPFVSDVRVFNTSYTSSVWVTATIKLYDGSTLLGTQSVVLGARSGTQVNRIFNAVGQGDRATTNAFAVVSSDNPNLGLFTYGAVIDNATADSSFVAGAADALAPAAPTPQTVNVSLVNYSFTPGTSSPIQVTAGPS